MKRIISILTIVTVVIFAGYNVHKAQQREVLSGIAMENVEALADMEWVPGKGWVCFENLLDDTSLDLYFIAIFCEDCNPHSATRADKSDYCTYTGMYG